MVIKPRVTVNGVVENEKSGGAQALEVIQIIGEIIILILKHCYFFCESVFRKFVAPPEESVKDEIVLITGTGHGIGRELALKYSSEGATVVCVDINDVNNDKTVSDVKKTGRKAHGYTCDVSDRAKVFELAEKIKKDVGVVSILVNNAGIMPTKPLLSQTEDSIDKTMKINVYAHFWLLQAFLPDMIKRNHGHVVALSSCAGLFGLENLVPYCATKFAVRGLMQALFVELRSANKNNKVKFTTICPYMVDTGLCKNPRMRFEKSMRMETPKEVAASIVSSQRRGLMEVTIPGHYYTLFNLTQLFPVKTALAVNDFLEAGLDPED